MKNWNIDSALKHFKKLSQNTYKKDSLSESDTRSKLIDNVLIECMNWDEHDITREERCVDNGTYLDYKLSTGTPILIIEAKKSSVDFELPSSTSQREYNAGGVIRNCEVLMKAVAQAKSYAISKGITFCCVTNGKQYIFFRSQNQQGIDWKDHKIAIFRNATDIECNFDEFCQFLSKASAENGELQQTLLSSASQTNGIAQFRTLDTRHLARPRNKDRNPLFQYIAEVIHRVFQDLASEDAESEILEHCYVNSPRKRDKATPYIDREIRPISVGKKDAGDFQQRISQALKAGKTDRTEVVFLLGSVGVGKSTFIQRFRKVLAKKEIDESGVWLYLNFKHFSDTGESLNDFIFDQIEDTLSTDYSEMGLTDWNFLKQAYHSEHEKLRKGALAPLFRKDPEAFELKFSEKVQEWMEQDKDKHLLKTLSAASKIQGKSVFLVFDNADQLTPSTQNSIFLAAQKLAEKAKCYALISMREESYWKNRDSGPLNAFHTTAYHVQPASFQQVLAKRFQYAKSLIDSGRFDTTMGSGITSDELTRIFDRLVQSLLSEDHRYIDFIESTSSRDTRRALDNVAAFMISGHTNIEAILKDERRKNPKRFPIPFHEFLNSIILRDHEVYIEDHCDVINLFNVSGNTDASNFNRIAILGRILNSRNDKSEIGTGYVLIENAVNDCHSVGILPETTISVLSILNSRRLIETETTIKDCISESKYVRVTVSGEYYVKSLSRIFGYLDLVICGTPIMEGKHFKKLNKIYEEINSLTSNTNQARLNRVKKRIELTEAFVDYLHAEFQKCGFRKMKDKFSPECTNLINDIKSNLQIEKKGIIQKAETIFRVS